MREFICCTLLTAVIAQCTTITPTLGCFNDQSGPHVVDDYSTGPSQSTTLESCTETCTDLGYGFIGLTGNTQDGASCYCGNTPNPQAVKAPSSQCNLPCPGNSSEICGGDYRMSLYNTSCNGPFIGPGAACSQPAAQAFPFCNTSLTRAERVSDLVSRISLAEAGAMLTARSSPALPRLGVPSFYWGTNVVHGITNAPSGGVMCVNTTGRCVTIWPAGPAMGSSFNASMWGIIGHTTGIEMRALNNLQWGPVARPSGLDGLSAWGPVVNLVRDPRWGRIQEVPSEDPLLNGVFAVAFTRGMQEGVDSRYLLAATTLKHFAAYSLEDYYDVNGIHYTRENINNLVSEFDASDTYFPAFQMGVSPVASGGAQAAGVMMAMNEFNGVPCLANGYLIDKLHNWSGHTYYPYIATDGGNMIDSMLAPYPRGHFYCPYHAAPCSRDEGIEAAAYGGSAICDGSEYNENLLSAVTGKNLTQARVNELLFETLSVRFDLGLFDPMEGQPYLQYGAADVNSDATQAANALASREALVLLQNPGNLLPFVLGSGAVTAIIGFGANNTKNYVGNYVNQYCPDNSGDCFPSLFQAVVALGEQASFNPGCSSAASCSPAQIAAAAAAAATADRIILMYGLDESQEGEQHDRFNLTVPAPQLALWSAVMSSAKPTTPIAVVLIHGGALAVPELKESRAAIIDAFYPGSVGGPAIADALFGRYNPGGKLPYTVYDAGYVDAVNFTDFSVASLGRTYRYHTPASPGGAPLWEFGFGLSYSTWQLSWAPPGPPPPLVLQGQNFSATLLVDVKNTGTVTGDEVVQAYFTPLSIPAPAPPFLPIKQLFAFERVHVAAGQTVRVSLSVSGARLMMTATDGSRAAFPGTYALSVTRGPTSTDDLAIGATVVA